jgi:hypothetical protein
MRATARRFFNTAPDLVPIAMEDRFFTDIKTRDGTFKRTASARFQDLDDACVASFAAAGAGITTVLDIGISSGATTLALFDRLAAAGHAPRLVGTDLSFEAYMLRVVPGFRTLVDEHGHPLQHEVFGQPVRPWVRRLDYFTGAVLLRGLLNRLAAARARPLVKRRDARLSPVRLISRRLAARPEIDIEANNVLERAPHFGRRFDFVRAANILNRGYFSEAELKGAFDNILSYLSGPGAWLLVARSTKRGHDATLFRASADGATLDVVMRMGAGSEVEDIVRSRPLPWGRSPA